jgi:hypothetical protein
MADTDGFQPREFKAAPSGPAPAGGVVKQFQRHRILNDEQFGRVTVPEPVRRFTAEGLGHAWMGRA